jgi:hypothetical protein
VTFVLTGTLMAVFGLLYALLTIVWLLAVLYSCIAWPLKGMRNACFSVHGFYGAWLAAWNGIVSLAIVAALLWFAYHHGPELHECINRFGQWWRGISVTSGTQST